MSVIRRIALSGRDAVDVDGRAWVLLRADHWGVHPVDQRLPDGIGAAMWSVAPGNTPAAVDAVRQLTPLASIEVEMLTEALQ